MFRLVSRAAGFWGLITKGFLTAKAFRAQGTNFLRQRKSLRGNGGGPGRPAVPGGARARGGTTGTAASVDPVLGAAFPRVANMIDSPARLLSPGRALRVLRAAGSARKSVAVGSA